VAVREPSRGEDLRATLEGSGTALRVVSIDDVSEVHADLIVNATPLGVHGERLPLPSLVPGVVGVDLLYRPSATPFQAEIREGGGSVFGGLGLLLHQAAISFELWTGQTPPLSVMSAAAVGELAEAGASD
jgi:shikimate dehydrogenase